MLGHKEIDATAEYKSERNMTSNTLLTALQTVACLQGNALGSETLVH